MSKTVLFALVLATSLSSAGAYARTTLPADASGSARERLARAFTARFQLESASIEGQCPVALVGQWSAQDQGPQLSSLDGRWVRTYPEVDAEPRTYQGEGLGAMGYQLKTTSEDLAVSRWSRRCYIAGRGCFAYSWVQIDRAAIGQNGDLRIEWERLGYPQTAPRPTCDYKRVN